MGLAGAVDVIRCGAGCDVVTGPEIGAGASWLAAGWDVAKVLLNDACAGDQCGADTADGQKVIGRGHLQVMSSRYRKNFFSSGWLTNWQRRNRMRVRSRAH